MPLTNAERQARYRARLKRKASLEGLGGRVHDLVDRTVDSLWAVLSRPAPDGGRWSEAEGFASLAEYRCHLAQEPGLLVATCRDMLWVAHMLDESEKALFAMLVEVADALALNPRD